MHIKDSQLFSCDGLVRNYHVSGLQENFLPRGYYLKHAEQVAPFFQLKEHFSFREIHYSFFRYSYFEVS